VGDLSRALEGNFSKYCEDIFVRLMQLLMNAHLHRSVKPPILSTFGDIALAIGKDFERYLEHAMTMLFNASQSEIDTSDAEEMEYMWRLQENILEGYSGIVQALRDEDRKAPEMNGRFSQALGKFLPNVVYLLEHRIVPLVQQPERDVEVLKAALNLLGDLAQALPAAKPHFQGQPWVQALLQVGQQEPGIDNEDVQFAAKIIQ